MNAPTYVIGSRIGRLRRSFKSLVLFPVLAKNQSRKDSMELSSDRPGFHSPSKKPSIVKVSKPRTVALRILGSAQLLSSCTRSIVAASSIA